MSGWPSSKDCCDPRVASTVGAIHPLSPRTGGGIRAELIVRGV